jgi:hypothetical protein
MVQDHRLAERGTHDQLRAADGLDAERHRIQFADEPGLVLGAGG